MEIQSKKVTSYENTTTSTILDEPSAKLTPAFGSKKNDYFSEVLVEGFDKTKKYDEHPFCNPNGGISLNIPDSTTDLMMSFVKKIASQLNKFDFDIINLIPPASTLHHETNLMLLASTTHILAKYVNAAIKATDPLKKLK